MSKTIPLSPEAVRAMKKQIRAFRKKFHRDPGPDDPLFFDPDADTPQFISEAKMQAIFDEVADAAKRANLPPDLIYAMRKTGRIVTEQNRHLLSPEEAAEWNAAIEEFKSLQ